MKIDTTAYDPCDNKDLTVYVYTSGEAKGESAKPAVVYCHGGGGIAGLAKHYDSHCGRIAVENDVVVLNVEYRLAPENKAPRGIMDAVGTVLYLADNGPQFGVDPKRMCIAGDSGGGYITAGAAMELAKRGKSDVVRLCLPMYPQVSNLFVRPKFQLDGIEKTTSKKFWQDLDKHLRPTAEQIKAEKLTWDEAYIYPALMKEGVIESYPPTAIITSEFDFLRRHAENLAEKLHAKESSSILSFTPALPTSGFFICHTQKVIYFGTHSAVF